ncbi:hypothetical protein LDENG_00219030, partial [Lucifuga dentata]
MNPLLYPYIIKQGRQLDFHKFTDKVAPVTFGYPPVLSGKFPGLHEHIQRCFQFLQGENLSHLTESVMGNIVLVFRKDHLGEQRVEDWRTGNMYDFCNSVMFEATFLTMYGWPASGQRHSEMSVLREEFVQFDSMFPLLMAQVPIWLLRRTNAIRRKLISYFLPDRMSCWQNGSYFIRKRVELLEQYDVLSDTDKAAHHFAILWASVGNTIPATFWAMYYLVSHPEAVEVIRHEIHSVLKIHGVLFDSDSDVILSREQLDQLVYLESAVKESLRLSSASMNIRVAQENFTLQLDGQHSVAVRTGDIIALYPQTMHMDPDIYEEPEVCVCVCVCVISHYCLWIPISF